MKTSQCPVQPEADIIPLQSQSPSMSELLSFSKAIADQSRLNILAILEQESFGVLELCQILSLKQPALTHHLKLLTDAGLLTRRREGNSIFYSRNHQVNSDLTQLQAVYFDAINSVELTPEINKRIRQIQHDRARRSEEFFQQHHERFSVNQELVAPVSAYETQLMDQLTECHGTVDGSDKPVLEIGPGDGQFLPSLAKIFDKVYALDNSSTMLTSAENHCEKLGIKDIQFILGDTQSEQLEKSSFSLVVMNMVLHHNASPVQLLEDIYKMLTPGASLFLSELSSHQQDWVREACGDLWLGFQPEELTRMASAVGYQEGASQYLAQRNGFVVQIRQFIKPKS